MAAWRGQGLTHASAFQVVDAACAHHAQMFRFDISGGSVVLHRKDGGDAGAAAVDSDHLRAEAYAGLLRESAPLAGLKRPISIAIDIGDTPPENPAVPFFAFQRRRGARVMLLPDIDLLALGYLEHPCWSDPYAFKDKRNQAIFVGATTGGFVTMETVRTLSLPRLRAARAFRDSSSVVFRLPRVVQYDTPETKAAVQALGFGDEEVPWAEQMRCRHLLSMDGNGATCSRVAIALRSNSVLLKYDSPYELFYFHALRAWTHFVPIHRDADVEQVVVDSRLDPARYRRIAKAGRRFALRHLTRAACQRYVAALLRAYDDMLDEAERR